MNVANVWNKGTAKVPGNGTAKGTAKGPAKRARTSVKVWTNKRPKGQSMDPGGNDERRLRKLQAKKARRASMLHDQKVRMRMNIYTYTHEK